MTAVAQFQNMKTLPFERELLITSRPCPRCGGRGHYATNELCWTCGGIGRRFSPEGRERIREIGDLLALNVVFDSKERLDLRALQHVKSNDLRPGMMVEEVMVRWFPRTDRPRVVRSMRYDERQVLIEWEPPGYPEAGWVPESVQWLRTLTEDDIDRAQVLLAQYVMYGRGVTEA